LRRPNTPSKVRTAAARLNEFHKAPLCISACAWVNEGFSMTAPDMVSHARALRALTLIAL
jgi:hypothetical protein